MNIYAKIGLWVGGLSVVGFAVSKLFSKNDTEIQNTTSTKVDTAPKDKTVGEKIANAGSLVDKGKEVYGEIKSSIVKDKASSFDASQY